MPKTVQRALEIDRETGTTFWRAAIAKEMTPVNPAFKFLDEGAAQPIGHTAIRGHIIFDFKMDFTRIPRFVADGHMTDPPSSVTYASVRIAFLIAALTDLDIMAADINGAYLNASCREKICIMCGPEFREYEGRWAIITSALYGLNLAATLGDQGFTSCLADPDVWLRPVIKANSTKYYEYLLVYTDDLMCLSIDPKEIF